MTQILSVTDSLHKELGMATDGSREKALANDRGAVGTTPNLLDTRIIRMVIPENLRWAYVRANPKKGVPHYLYLEVDGISFHYREPVGQKLSEQEMLALGDRLTREGTFVAEAEIKRRDTKRTDGTGRTDSSLYLNLRPTTAAAEYQVATWPRSHGAVTLNDDDRKYGVGDRKQDGLFALIKI